MKILLIGEYSNVHATLAEGLRAIGHQVTVVSDGDGWKNYPRDIDVSRASGKFGGVSLMVKLYTLLSKLRGYDVVQLINPMFFELKAERLFFFYNYLRKHNKKVFLGAFGMDYYWVNECIERNPLRYSDFNFGSQLRTDEAALTERRDWLGTVKEQLNKLIADNCDGIITGLYEYHVCYQPHYPDKTRFIPYPIRMPDNNRIAEPHDKLNLFVGISKKRSAYKGTDIMLKAAKAISAKYPEQVVLKVANGIPFAQYEQMLDSSDAILDQLYSYTPAMNALLAMSKGIIVVGGGEPENYEILGEQDLRPVVNVEPNYESVFHELEQLVLHPERIPELKRQSIAYIQKHHDYMKVAKEYETFYNEKSQKA